MPQSLRARNATRAVRAARNRRSREWISKPVVAPEGAHLVPSTPIWSTTRAVSHRSAPFQTRLAPYRPMPSRWRSPTPSRGRQSLGASMSSRSFLESSKDDGLHASKPSRSIEREGGRCIDERVMSERPCSCQTVPVGCQRTGPDVPPGVSRCSMATANAVTAASIACSTILIASSNLSRCARP